MSKLLRYLLEAEEPLFTQSLRELEFLTQKKGIDVRLTADILEKNHAALRGLGLDSNDTTDKELFFALKQRVHEHNYHLSTALGIDTNATSDTITKKLINAIQDSKLPRRVWVIKRAVAKNLLRNMPPNNLMKQLKYRSIESMLKNENFSELYVALRFSEGQDWLERFNQQFASQIQPSDFETRQVEVVQIDRKLAELSKKHISSRMHPVVHVKELGILGIVPLDPNDTKGMVIRVLPLLFHYLNEIRLYSAFFKLKSIDPKFGEIITRTLTSEAGVGASIANFHIHWRVIQRYFGQQKDTPELFQPHVQPEDLLWRKAEESLYEMSSELKFWQGMDYVAMRGDDGLPVSFNLTDAALNYACDVPFTHRSIRYFRESLWNEIFMRYMGENTLKAQVLAQLDKSVVMPEELA